MRIGIDLGGTKIEGILLDADGTIRARYRTPTPRDDYDATLEGIADLVARLETEAGGSAPVGVGTPGVISPVTGLIKNANSVWLNGRPLGEDLTRRLGRPVRLANDANCFALSEAVDGAAAAARVVFGVILGTGTGGGLVIDRRVHEGPNRVAGEWGHLPLPWPREDERPGPDCYCGRTGCIETYLSGPGFARDHASHTGEDLPPEAIAARAGGGNPGALETVARYLDRVARGLAAVINVVDPDLIVLGGGMSKLRGLYDGVPARWGEYVFSDRVVTPLRPPHHGDSGGVRGAAWLWEADPA